MILEMRNLTKCYGEKEALKMLNLELHPGIYGLLGPNGAGKSTLMKLICMLIEPTEGQIFFDGEDIRKRKREFLKVLGYMPQQTCLYPEFRVEEYLYYIGALKGMEQKTLCASTERLLDKVHLSEVKGHKIKTLSGGMQQRLMFAQALLDNPKVVILDEPTAGLDPQKRIEMRNMVAEAAKDKIILIATHIVSDVELIANKILLLHQGQFLAADTVNGLTEQLYGRVYEVEVEGTLKDLESRCRVSTVYNKSGRIYAKIILDQEENPPRDGRLIYPDMEDVYLYHFGEEEDR